MTQSSLVELARGGDPYAIAVLLNQALHAKGVTARAALTDDCLHILLESEQASPQPDVMSILSRGILQLRPDAIAKTIVYARQKGQGEPDWTQQLEMDASSPPAPPLRENIDMEVLSPDPGLEILDNIPPASANQQQPAAVTPPPDPSAMAFSETPWYLFLAIGILLLLFFPAGLYLIWYRTRWPAAIKCAIAVPFILLLAALLAPPKPAAPPPSPKLPSASPSTVVK